MDEIIKASKNNFSPQKAVRATIDKLPHKSSVNKQLKILLIGTGGIGVELLKNLLSCDFRDIHIVDLDTIELSNLNRQFLFRQMDIGKSKAETAKLRSSKFNTSTKIVAHHGDITTPALGIPFFRQFDLVANALDNLPTRRHVNRLCLALGKPLVESGTQGFSGQVYLIRGGLSECYECTEKSSPKTYPVCTIRDTPDKPVHCIAWAKLMFSSLFGPAENKNELSDLRKARKDGEDSREYAVRLFEHLFTDTINERLAKLASANENTESEKPKIRKNQPKPLHLNEIIAQNGSKTHQNGFSASKEGKQAEKCPESLSALADLFTKTVQKVVSEGLEGKCAFDKDDETAMDFVHSASALRMANYGIARISRFEAKGIAGNIVHAVATTNAVCAGLMAKLIQRVAAGDASSCKRSWIQLGCSGPRLIQPEALAPPSSSCFVCNKKRLDLVCNVRSLTVRKLFDDVMRTRLGMLSPAVDVSYGATANFISEELSEWDGNAQWRESYFENVLAHEHVKINHGSILSVTDDKQAFSLDIVVVHCQDLGDEGEEEEFFLYKQGEYSICHDKKITGKKRQQSESNGNDSKENILGNSAKKPAVLDFSGED